jgi:KTSC domain-containing protein
VISSTHTIALEPVSSKALAAIGYDADAHQLAVQFPSGHIWHYSNVQMSDWEAFQAAPSKGAFYAAEIKKSGKFTAEKVTGVCGSCKDIGLKATRCGDCGCADYE